VREILEGAIKVFAAALTIAAVLIVFWIVGIIAVPGTSSAPFMSGVGTGIKWTFTQLGVLIKAL
jgi:hypothetical protein